MTTTLYIPRFVSPALSTLMLVTAVFVLMSTPAQANLNTDLQDLNAQANELKTYLKGVQITSDASSFCGPLVTANHMTHDMVASITAINQSLSAPLSIDADMLTTLDSLSDITVDLANQALRLSLDIQTLSTTMDMLSIKDGLAAMLQLSSDIGTMADRIGAMADNILVMSDNIGLMADRILVTQQLQNENVELTINSILQTQTNMLTVVSVIEDTSYDLEFARLITEGGLLAGRMSAVVFSPWTLDSQLRTVKDDVKAFLANVQAVKNQIISDSAQNTIYISYDGMIQLSNISLMLTSLATAIDGYVIAIEGMQAVTSSGTLEDAMQSILIMSADIGQMSNSILEMGDQILVMSDNIGMQADQILLTQQAMNLNVATTQTAILGAQQMAIGIISARNL